MNIDKYEFPHLKPMQQDANWAHRYCYDILKDNIPSCQKMKWAAIRHFKDLERDDLYWDHEAASSIVAWFRFCPIIKGPKSGTPTILDPSQIFMLASLIAWKWSDDMFELDESTGQSMQVRHKGKRRYNQFYGQVSRKYGKTTLMAGLKLYLMHKYKFGPRVFSLATKKDQAKEVWNVAKKMIKLSPRLSTIFDARANDILQPKKEGEFKALASDSSSLDGLDPVAACLDECFIAGTLIDGVPIENIKIGDKVKSYCEIKKELVTRKVDKLYRQKKSTNVYTISVNGKEISCTGNHPIFTKEKEKWIDAKDIVTGDILMGDNGESLEVLSVSHAHMEVDVYNFSVEDTHTYFANGILVHNCHAIKDRNLYGVLISAFGSNEGGEYLFSIITTAGFILDGLCTDIYKNGARVLNPNDQSEQDNYFYVIFEIDKDDDWEDEKNWYKSNPALVYGRPSMQYMRDRFKEASMSVAEKGNFLTKHCNLFVNSSDTWLNFDDVVKCSNPELDFNDYKDKKCFVGVDRALVGDITSCVPLFPDDDGGCTIFPFNMQSKGAFDEAGDYLRSIYMKAEDSDDLEIINGNTVRNTDVKELIRYLWNELTQCEGFYYDPYHMKEVAMELESEGIPMIAVSQGTGNMAEPSLKLESLIKEGLFRYNGSTLFEFGVSCAQVGITKNNNMHVYRDTSSYKTEKIDPLIATIIALSGATLTKQDEFCYNDRGMLFL